MYSFEVWCDKYLGLDDAFTDLRTCFNRENRLKKNCEDLERTNHKLKSIILNMEELPVVKQSMNLTKENQKLQKIVDVYEEVVMFYGDYDNWYDDNDDQMFGGEYNKGDKARQTLKEVRENLK